HPPGSRGSAALSAVRAAPDRRGGSFFFFFGCAAPGNLRSYQAPVFQSTAPHKAPRGETGNGISAKATGAWRPTAPSCEPPTAPQGKPEPSVFVSDDSNSSALIDQTSQRVHDSAARAAPLRSGGRIRSESGTVFGGIATNCETYP